MNRKDMPGTDLATLLKQTLKDDLPPEAEAQMVRHFSALRKKLERQEAHAVSHRFPWGFGILRTEILGFISVILLIVGGMIYLSGNQSVLAHSIEAVKTVVTVSSCLARTTSMDCTIFRYGDNQNDHSYRIRWAASGISRVDLRSSNGREQTLWIPDTTRPRALYESFSFRAPSVPAIPADPVWQPALDVLTPAALAQRMESRFGLVRALHQDDAARNEVILIGRDSQQAIEVAVDGSTYLPKTLKKYRQDSSPAVNERTCFEEIRFQWNQPVPKESLLPRSTVGSRPAKD